LAKNKFSSYYILVLQIIYLQCENFTAHAGLSTIRYTMLIATLSCIAHNSSEDTIIRHYVGFHLNFASSGQTKKQANKKTKITT